MASNSDIKSDAFGMIFDKLSYTEGFWFYAVRSPISENIKPTQKNWVAQICTTTIREVYIIKNFLKNPKVRHPSPPNETKVSGVKSEI